MQQKHAGSFFVVMSGAHRQVALAFLVGVAVVCEGGWSFPSPSKAGVPAPPPPWSLIRLRMAPHDTGNTTVGADQLSF